MGTTTIHPAESYLRNETNPSSLYVRIAGKRRRLFINRDRGIIGIIVLGKRIKGYVFTDWSSIEQIYYPSHFEVLETDNEVALLLAPFQTALKNKAMEQLEGMIGTLRVYTSCLATKESYWIFYKDGDDLDMKEIKKEEAI